MGSCEKQWWFWCKQKHCPEYSFFAIIPLPVNTCGWFSGGIQLTMADTFSVSTILIWTTITSCTKLTTSEKHPNRQIHQPVVVVVHLIIKYLLLYHLNISFNPSMALSWLFYFKWLRSKTKQNMFESVMCLECRSLFYSNDLQICNYERIKTEIIYRSNLRSYLLRYIFQNPSKTVNEEFNMDLNLYCFNTYTPSAWLFIPNVIINKPLTYLDLLYVLGQAHWNHWTHPILWQPWPQTHTSYPVTLYQMCVLFSWCYGTDS